MAVFPASAGVILYKMELAMEDGSFPRIRGGDPVVKTYAR